LPAARQGAQSPLGNLDPSRILLKLERDAGISCLCQQSKAAIGADGGVEMF
jgi:hypothetical protein